MKKHKFILLTVVVLLLVACTYHSSEAQRKASIYTSRQNTGAVKHYPNENKEVFSRDEQVVKTYPYKASAVNKNTDYSTYDKPLTPAVVALLSKADQSYKAGEYDQAVSTIERALRIEPRNARLVYKLAAVRLRQKKAKLAENLAKKAALLAGNNTLIKRRAWLLIAEARRMQGNLFVAKEAKTKAENY